MSDTKIYRKHWENDSFVDSFRAFKNYTLPSEEEFAIRCADIIAKSLVNKEPDVFEIGFGNGLVTNYFLTQLRKLLSIKSYKGIDISQELIKEAEQRLTEHKGKFPFELSVADATTYIPESDYDLIYGFNAWYGIPFNRIKDFLGSLKPDGILAILLNTELNLTIDVTNKFKPEESVTSSEQLMRWLNENQLSYTEHLVTSELSSRKNFLNQDGVIPEAYGFFSYLLRGDMSHIHEIGQYMQDKPELYFQLPQHLILIRKVQE